MMLGLIKFRNSLKKWQTPAMIIFKELLHKEATLIPVSWKKPRCGWTKLNFDGSSRGGGASSSIGGVFRNDRAEFLLGYAEAIGSGVSSTVAEMVALRRGLELSVEHGWRDVWVEGDAMSVVEMMKKNEVMMKKLNSSSSCEEAVKRHVRMIKLMMGELNNCVVTHVYREGNRAADKLAKIGHGLDTPGLWRHLPPTQLLHIVNEDAQGKIILRRSRKEIITN